MALAVFARTAVLGDEFSAIFKIEQGVFSLVDGENNVAALSAVAAVGAAVGNVFFTVERNASVSAVTCCYIVTLSKIIFSAPFGKKR